MCSSDLTLDEKAKKYLAHENIDCFNQCNKKHGKPEITEECLERMMTLSAIQFFDESIDFYYNISNYISVPLKFRRVKY